MVMHSKAKDLSLWGQHFYLLPFDITKMPDSFSCLHFLKQIGHKLFEFSERFLLVDRIVPFLKKCPHRTDNGSGRFQSLCGEGRGVVH